MSHYEYGFKKLYTVLWYYSYLDSSGLTLGIQIAVILLTYIYIYIYISLISFLQCVSVCNDDGTGYNSIIVFASDDFPNNFTLQWEPYPSDSFYIVQHRFQDSGSQFISSPIVS